MTSQEMAALVTGSMVKLTNVYNGWAPGSVFIKVEQDEDNADCVHVFGPLDIEDQDDLESVYCNRFERYTLDRSLVVRNVGPDTSRRLQLAAFDNGWQWGDGSTQVINTGSRTITFHHSEKRIYHGDDDYDGRINLNARNRLHVTAALLALGQPAPNIPMTLEQLVGDEVASLIRNSPTSPTLRGMIRAATLKAIPVETMGAGTEAITAWILENVKTPVHPSQRELLVPPAPVAIERHREPTIDVSYRVRESQTGTCVFSRTVTYEGEYPVPESIVREGEEAVEEYIRENYNDDGPDDYGDEDTDRHEVSDSEITSFTCGASAACEQYEEAHPEAAANE